MDYFGDPPNADAAPSANPDGDPNNNEMEFLTGFDPTDGNSWFQLVYLGNSGTTASLLLNKVIPGRTYRIEAGPDLKSFSETVLTLSSAVEERDKLVTDPNASQKTRFYRVDVTKP